MAPILRRHPRIPLRTLVVTGLALTGLIGLAGCSDDGNDSAGPTTAANQTTATTSASASETIETTEAGVDQAPDVAAVDDLSDVRWVINTFEGLIDDRGRRLTANGSDLAGPSTARDDQGNLVFIEGDTIMLWKRDEAQPAPWQPPPGVDLSSADLALASLRPDTKEITAGNGVMVRVVDAEVETNVDGVVSEVLEPARLQVFRPDGSLEWNTPAGGIQAVDLLLIDFDGRRVMMARAPQEPADPSLQHIVYDLDCSAVSINGAGCTETFWAPYGRAALIGPDQPDGQVRLNIQLLDICPTYGQTLEVPPDLDPEFVPPYRRAAAKLSTCDAYAVGSLDPGLEYNPATGADGWLWTEFARALTGPYRAVDDPGPGYEWQRHPDRAIVQLVDVGAYVAELFLPPNTRLPDPIAITLTGDTLALFGRADQATVDLVLGAARRLSRDRELELISLVEVGGVDRPRATVEPLVKAIDEYLRFPAEVTVGEVQLTDDGVRGWSGTTTEPNDDQAAVAFAFGDFASGGEGSFADLPLAPEVGLALGGEIVAIKSRDDLATRPAWTVALGDFRGRSGTANLLTLTPAPARFAVGPSPRCASPYATPAPPELLSYERISIEPAEGSIDSCLEWSAIYLFVDDAGLIHGVSLELHEP